MIRIRGFTIGGLMWVTFVVSFGLAALRNASGTWAGVTFLVTCGILACAIVSAVCRPTAERPWWLGFTLFGCGYMCLAFWGLRQPRLSLLPTNKILAVLAPLFQAPPQSRELGGFEFEGWDYHSQVGHCVWGLLFATLGGLIALAVCSLPRGRTSAPDIVPDQHDQVPPTARWRRPATAAFGGSVLLVVGTRMGYPRAHELLAGTFYLLTCVLIGVAILGTGLSGAKRRAEWFGVALFGGWYLIFHLGTLPDGQTWSRYRATKSVLTAVRPWLISEARVLHGSLRVNDEANVRIEQKLEQRVPMKFPNETPLEDVLVYVKSATQGPDDHGIRIYIDPVGLQEAEHTLQSPIQLDLEGIPLRTTLPLMLKQLGMTYFIRDGLLVITAESAPNDPYFLVGHCVLTWVAAGLGGVLAPLVADTRRSRQ